MPETRPSYATLATRNEVTDVDGATILSVTSEAPLYRKENLLDPRRSRRWRSSSNTQQQITGQFASAITPRQVALIGSNLDTNAGDVEDALEALNVWLRAYDIAQADNTSIAAWANAGTSGGTFTQGTAGNKPTYQTGEIDNKPVVRFDGTDDLLQHSASGINLGTQHTIISVVKFTSVGATQNRWIGSTNEHVKVQSNVLYYYDNSLNSASVSWTPNANQWYCVRIVRNGTSVSFYVDGVQVGTTQTLAGNASFTLFVVGVGSTATMHGDIAEIMASTSSTFESSGYGLALQDFLYARYLGSTAATGLTTMALSSLLVEFHSTSAFGSLGTRWALQSYTQTGRRVQCWYTRAPDSFVPAATAANRANPDPILDIVFGTSFWRLTLPTAQVLDSDGDGTVDTYHELGNVWIGNYTELPIDFDFDIQVQDPSLATMSDAGARFVDRLRTFHEVSVKSSSNLESVSYPLLSALDDAGTSRHVLLDVWAPQQASAALARRMGCYYGFLGGGRGNTAKLIRRLAGRDDVAFTFTEARA